MQKAVYFKLFVLVFTALSSCKQAKKEVVPPTPNSIPSELLFAKGFTIQKAEDRTILSVTAPWPGADAAFKYALIPKEKMAFMTLNKDDYDAIIAVPIEHMVVTSTTHIPALEALGIEEKLVGFPDTKFISSKKTRKRIAEGKIKELGTNDALNTELVIDLKPEVVIGFGINSENKAYQTLERSNIPIVYNGDWTEETPLGKAEWIKFFAPFFQKERIADSIFNTIKTEYETAKNLAQTATKKPTVLSGSMFKDVWYLPGGKSWAAQFMADANANYLWKDTQETGSLSLSWERVLETGKNADFWIGPGLFTTYADLSDASMHYEQFTAFQQKKIFTYANTVGETGGLLYFELAPQRPDLVLKDLIHIFHPELVSEHESYFFKPLN